MRAVPIRAAPPPGVAAAQAVVARRYADPTDRSGHRVMGAGGEWGVIDVNAATKGECRV